MGVQMCAQVRVCGTLCVGRQYMDRNMRPLNLICLSHSEEFRFCGEWGIRETICSTSWGKFWRNKTLVFFKRGGWLTALQTWRAREWMLVTEERHVHSLEVSDDEDGGLFHDLTRDGRDACNKVADSERLSYEDGEVTVFTQAWSTPDPSFISLEVWRRCRNGVPEQRQGIYQEVEAGGRYKDGLVRLCHHEMEVSKQIMMWTEFMMERAVRKAVEAEGEPGWMWPMGEERWQGGCPVHVSRATELQATLMASLTHLSFLGEKRGTSLESLPPSPFKAFQKESQSSVSVKPGRGGSEQCWKTAQAQHCLSWRL